MNPAFELDQILRYIDHLDGDPRQLAETAESHFFPVLQRIFFREAFEVKNKQLYADRKYDFQLVDLDKRRPDVLVDFSFTTDNFVSMIPGAILEALEASKVTKNPPNFLILRNRPLSERVIKTFATYGPRLRFLDFEGLKHYASWAFAAAEERDSHRALVIVRDMVENLIIAVADQDITIADIEWRDMERLVYETLRGLGFHAHLTAPSDDGGRDIVACDIQVNDVLWFNIEVKHWRNQAVGSKEASATLDTAIAEGRRGALLLSPKSPGRTALSVRSEIQRNFLRFGSEAKIVQSCKHYVSKKGGLWQPLGGLRSFLFQETV